MANAEHLAILKQGVEAWNKWRQENLYIRPDLIRADLRRAYLRRAYLSGAKLSGAILSGAILTEANLSGAKLGGANLSGAGLSEAKLGGAYLSGADLRGANLTEADLRGAYLSGAKLSAADLSRAYLIRAHLIEANLSGANLSGANLSGANLGGAKLSGAGLSEADFANCVIVHTIFIDVDLSTVKGLTTVKHQGPSTIGIDTIYKSKGKIPAIFLRGAGVPDQFIEYIAALVGQAIQFYSCFISYSSHDQAFADRLYADLQNNNVRCWFAPEHMKIGARLRPTIDEAIRVYDKLLLVLSESSINSQWVEEEVERALQKERDKPGSTVLFPVRLDDVAMTTTAGWANLVRNTRNIGNFCCWKEHDAYQKALQRLLRDLKAETGTWQAPDIPLSSGR